MAGDLHDKYRDQLTTPEKWIDFSNDVSAFVRKHGNDNTVAVRMGMFLLDLMEELYKDGRRPEPVRDTFFDEEAYA